MKKNVTAKDIAKLCGVSQATVSYVINNRQNQKISEETRRKVLDAVETLHYYPNASAKSMRTKNCTSIGIVCAKDYSRQAFLNAFTGISQYLSQIDYTITIFNEIDDIDFYVKEWYKNKEYLKYNDIKFEGGEIKKYSVSEFLEQIKNN